MTADFRDAATWQRAEAFVEALNALLEEHGFHIECTGYECEGIELEPGAPKEKLKLPASIWPSYACHSVTLETE